ncbi:MAG: hypothetical protein ACP5LP_01330 [Candidatus Micrarchaeia archaeon]
MAKTVYSMINLKAAAITGAVLAFFARFSGSGSALEACFHIAMA